MAVRAISIISSALMLALPATAHASEEEAWTTSATELRAAKAGVSLPQTIGSISLSKSGEVSHGGEGIDNYAQYLSADGAIQATLYVYMPSYADASLAAHMTDRAVKDRFGARTQRTAYAAVPLAGKSNGAIRAVYDDAADGALTTAAAFAHAGPWVLKLRVTGPTERRREVLASLDGMMDGLKFDQPESVHATTPANFQACPGTDESEASLGHQAAVPVTNDEGRTKLCISGQVQTADGLFDLLRRPGAPNGGVIVPVDDAGTLFSFAPVAAGSGYQLSIYSVGGTEIRGTYDKLPNARQIAGILEGKDSQTAQAKSMPSYAASSKASR